VENMKRSTKTLFELSMEEKKKLWQTEGDLEGFGQAFIISEEQKLEWGDAFFLNTLPPHRRKPHIYNQIPQTFRFSVSFSSLFFDADTFNDYSTIFHLVFTQFTIID
jgi:hypothetical protein